MASQALQAVGVASQSLHGVDLPASQQTLASGDGFTQPLPGVNFPTWACGDFFNQSLQSVVCPAFTQIRQPLRGVNFPASRQTLACGDYFNQSMQGAGLLHVREFDSGAQPPSLVAGRELPSISADIDSWSYLNQPLQGVHLTASLQTWLLKMASLSRCRM